MESNQSKTSAPFPKKERGGGEEASRRKRRASSICGFIAEVKSWYCRWMRAKSISLRQRPWSCPAMNMQIPSKEQASDGVRRCT